MVGGVAGAVAVIIAVVVVTAVAIRNIYVAYSACPI